MSAAAYLDEHSFAASVGQAGLDDRFALDVGNAARAPKLRTIEMCAHVSNIAMKAVCLPL